jgi:hypothetical protein
MRHLRRDCGHWRRFAASRRAEQDEKPRRVKQLERMGCASSSLEAKTVVD